MFTSDELGIFLGTSDVLVSAYDRLEGPGCMHSHSHVYIHSLRGKGRSFCPTPPLRTPPVHHGVSSNQSWRPPLLGVLLYYYASDVTCRLWGEKEAAGRILLLATLLPLREPATVRTRVSSSAKHLLWHNWTDTYACLAVYVSVSLSLCLSR